MSKGKKIYILSIVLIIFVVSIMYFSYAIFTETKEYSGKLNVVAGTLDYKIESDDLSENKITLDAKETKKITVKISSLNSIDSKYNLYYTTTGNIEIGYVTDKDGVVETIESDGIKTVELVLRNNSSTKSTATLKIVGGFSSNEISVEDEDMLEIVPAYSSTTKAINSFDSSELSDVLMCGYIEADDNIYYYDCNIHDTIANAIDSRDTGAVIAINDTEITSEITIADTKDIRLELNGKTITAPETMTTRAIGNFGVLTVNDSIGTGKMIAYRNLIYSWNELYINSGSYYQLSNDNTETLIKVGGGKGIVANSYFENTATWGILYLNSTDYATMEINNCRVVSNNNIGILNWSDHKDSVLTINNTTVESASVPVVNYSDSIINVNNSTVIATGTNTDHTGAAVQNRSYGTININNSKLTANAIAFFDIGQGTTNINNSQLTANLSAAIAINSWNASDSKAKLNINNSYLYSANNSAIVNYSLSEITINGDEATLSNGAYQSGTYLYSDGYNSATVNNSSGLADSKVVINGGTIGHGAPSNGTWRQAALRLEGGVAYINGGHLSSLGNDAVEGGIRTVYANANNAIINILGGIINGGIHANTDTNIYVCSGSPGFVSNLSAGHIYFRSSGINWLNTPTTNANMIQDDSITCQ